MIDHLGINVSDYERGRDFYTRALAPLGLSLMMEPMPGIGGFGSEGKPWFWITDQRQPTTQNVHVGADFVSLRATAWDDAGNRVEQEIIRAYGLD